MKLPLYSRREMCNLIAEMGLRIGVEVGVRAGVYSKTLLDCSPLEKLHGVDLGWTKDTPQERDFLERAKKSLKVYEAEGRYAFLPGDSCELAATFDNDSLDFIYIDADHSYDSVRKDIAAWWPKLRHGGLFAGHDYVLSPALGVVYAVDEFAEQYKQDVFVLGCEHPQDMDAKHLVALLGICGPNNGVRRKMLQHIPIKTVNLSPSVLDKYESHPSWWCIKN